MFRKAQRRRSVGLTFLVLACVLLAQLHAGAHLLVRAKHQAPTPDSQHSQGLKCHGCAVGPWVGPVSVSNLPGPMASVWLEGLPQPVLFSQDAFQLTASRAPPLA